MRPGAACAPRAPNRCAAACTRTASSSGGISSPGSPRSWLPSATPAPATATELPMSAARNDPCPCGSGRRFKHCCGAVQGVAASGSAAPGSPEVTKLVAVLEGGQLAQAESQAAARLAEEPGNGLLWKVLSVAQMRQGK